MNDDDEPQDPPKPVDPPAPAPPPGFLQQPGEAAPGYPQPPGYAPPGYPPPGNPPPPGYAPPTGYPPPQGYGAPPPYPPPGYAIPPGYPVPPGYPPPGYSLPPGYAWQGHYQPDNMGSGRFRAQGLAELIDSAFTLYRRNFLLFMSIAAVLLVPEGLLQVLLGSSGLAPKTSNTFGIAPQPTDYNQAVQQLGTSVVYLLIIASMSVIFSALSQGALTTAVSQRYLDRQASLGGSLRAALSRVWALMGFVGLVYGSFIGVFVILILLIFVSPALAAVGLIGFAVGIIVFIFVVYPRLFTVPTCIVVERVGPIKAIRRCWSLNSRATLRALGFLLIVIVINGILGAVLSGIAVAFNASHLIFLTTQAVLSLALTPFEVIAYTLYYYDMRIRRENFDLEMLAETL